LECLVPSRLQSRRVEIPVHPAAQAVVVIEQPDFP
jgi:hypothetical protein